jgi:hypothetical protein
MDAAIAHQKMVLEALNTLQSEGRSAPQEVAVAQNTLNVLNSERELIQQMVAALKTVTLLEESAGENVDTIVLPIPVVKDLYNASAISHVSYRLHDDATRNAAAEIQTLIAELQKHEASARHTLLGERHRRISELNDPSTIRERELLSLRQAAYKAATIADISNLPILAHSTQQYRLGNETVGGEVALFRLAAENSREVQVVNSQIAVAEVRVQALQVLQNEGFASWWETEPAKAALQDLQTEVQRLKLIGRINALSLQIVEQSEPILSTDRTLAMSP